MSLPKLSKEGQAPDLKAVSAAGGTKDAFLGTESKVVGTLTFAGPVELNGQVEGEIIAQNKLLIGESAKIKAKITGTEITVRGTIEGDIVASQRLTLKAPAKIAGNISTGNLTIEEGVFFEGKCVMGQGAGAAERSQEK